MIGVRTFISSALLAIVLNASIAADADDAVPEKTTTTPTTGSPPPETPSNERRPMTTVEAIVLGVVEGLTEYLPVSSTGHLILAQRAMGIANSAAANAFAICIQAGAIAAVLVLYFRRVRQMANGVLGRDVDGRRLAINVVAAFVPAAVIGTLFDAHIERYLFGLWPVVAAWFVGGVAILVVAWRRRAKSSPAGRELESLTLRMAVLVGVAQCLAMWPGTSRSLVTIVGGVLVGLRLSAAVEFSFLLGVVTLSAATAYKAASAGSAILDSYGWDVFTLGFVAATLSAMAAVRWMVAYLNNHGLALFAYYRIVLALLVGGLVLAGTLH